MQTWFRASGSSLIHPHRPLFGVQTEQRQGSVLAEGLHPVDLLVAPVVALSRLTFAVPVSPRTAPAPMEGPRPVAFRAYFVLC